jgi:hypothetical protein
MAVSPSTREWSLVLVAVPLALVLFSIRGGGLGKGDVIDAPLTLTTADRDQLSCAMAAPVRGHRCGFTPSGEPTGEATPLAPYLTTTRTLFLLPGLFQQPALAARVAEEPPEDRPPESLRRFVAQCRVRILERAEGVHIRFSSTAPFGPPETAWVAEILDCQVNN